MRNPLLPWRKYDEPYLLGGSFYNYAENTNIRIHSTSDLAKETHEGIGFRLFRSLK